jgi:Subtilase family
MGLIPTQGRMDLSAGTLHAVLASVVALLVLIALPCASALATEGAVAPLPESDYTVRHVCAAPAAGYAGCLALELVPKTAAARAHTHPLGITTNRPIVAAKASEGAFGLRPQDLHSIYRLPTTVASTQTIALVDAYNDLSSEADLKVYDEEFGLPECTSANACFEQVNQRGQNGKTGTLPFPASKKARAEEEAVCENGTEEEREKACKEVEEAEGWAEEISLDIEASHATCESCKIVLVEADSASFADLEAAEQAAVELHATEISNSWGGPQPDETAAEDNASSFNHPGIVITAAAGDDGYLDWDAPEGSTIGFADYPAASPHVVAVGGTRLQGPLGPGETWVGETVWNGDGATGGGCSVRLTAPPWQQSTSGWESVGCGGHRAVADVSADADPYTGVAVYDSGFECEYEPDVVVHWCPIGGTSLASPLVASIFALAGGANGVEYPAQTLYENETEDPATLHDILSGSNGECTKQFNVEEGLAAGTSGCTVSEEAAQCGGKAICTAGPGYDGPTGVGTPDGIEAFKPVSEEVRRANEASRAEQKREAEQLLEAARQREEKREEAERVAASGAGGGATGSVGTSPGSSLTPSLNPSPAASLSPSLELTAFALTPTALLALNRARPKVSSVGFAFTLSAAARVRATLAKLVRARGRDRWVTVPGALTFSATKGRNQRHLTSSDGLTSGRYRLTLAPQAGATRTLTFEVG